MEWFAVDKQGLAKLLERKGKTFAVFELIQNAWDTKAKSVTVKLLPIANSPYAELSVIDDDPNGFTHLSHAFTLFAESDKKGDPEQRGRFNLGEKLVLALCRKATIASTKGSITFDERGRHSSIATTGGGSRFNGEIRMTRSELADVEREVQKLLPPTGVRTTFNGTVLPQRTPVAAFNVYLPTEIANEEGYLKRVERTTTVEVFEPLEEEATLLYEMGIPVVETEDRWHVNVCQKVPLNSDRDNVTPSYLQKVRVAVLNHMSHRLMTEDASAGWVRDAMAHPDAQEAAVTTVMTKRFGENRVINDPSDPEGTKLAMSKGYTVIPGGSLSAGEWNNVKRFQAALPAGQVTPSPKPYSPDGEPLKVMPPATWTEGMEGAARIAKGLARRLMGTEIDVDMANDMALKYVATYGAGHLVFNVARLGKKWFDNQDPAPLLELVIHEFGHHYSSDHLSEKYHDALCMLGAKLAILACDPNVGKMW